MSRKKQSNEVAPVGEVAPAEVDEPKKKRKKLKQYGARRTEALSTQEGREAVGAALTELAIEFNQPKVMSDTQLKERLNQYLNRCVRAKQYPTVEEGLLSTGYSKQYMLDIAKGKARGRYFTPEAAEIITKFLDIVAALDAKMVMTGVAPQIPYIYRSKNFYGMSDKTEVQVAVAAPEEELDAEEIAKRYVIEASFAEDTDDGGGNGGGEE